MNEAVGVRAKAYSCLREQWWKGTKKCAIKKNLIFKIIKTA